MKEAEYLNPKANFQFRKRPLNGKLFQNQKIPKEQLVLSTKKAMGKKYMQQHNIFKQRQDQPKKQHRQIVMSEQFIKSSKLYRLLKQKMDRSDSLFIKQVNSINDHKMKLKQQINQLKSQNYQQKVSLWQLKNKLMQLKIMFHEEQQQNKRLAEQNYAQYQQQDQQMEQQQNQMANNQGNQQNPIQINPQTHQSINLNQSQHNYKSKGAYEEYKSKQISLSSDNQPNNDNKSSRIQFSQILQQLMSLKAQRANIQKKQKQILQNQKSLLFKQKLILENQYLQSSNDIKSHSSQDQKIQKHNFKMQQKNENNQQNDLNEKIQCQEKQDYKKSFSSKQIKLQQNYNN